MAINQLTTSIISQMGNSSSSLLPILTKDLSSSTLQTYMHGKKGGLQDGKERAIEEFGTCFIWIAGIPILKKVFDKTVYKWLNINPDVDIRKFKEKNTDNIAYTKSKLSKDSFEYAELERALKNSKISKGLFGTKFVFATLATMAALIGLITYKQNTTEKDVEKKYMSKAIMLKHISEQKNIPKVFQDFKGISNTQKNDKPSFKGHGIGEFFADFMLNPVKNMAILDGAITTTRLTKGREAERDEILIKEFTVIAFYYFLAKPIQNMLEKISEKLFKRPISLDYKVLSDNEFKNSIKDGSLQKSVLNFKNSTEGKGNKAILDFIYDNKDEKVVKMLKKSGEVPTVKVAGEKFLGIIPTKAATEKIDSLAYMDADNIKSVVKNLGKMLESTSEHNVDNFLMQAKKLKTASIFLNIAIAVAVIGVIQPLITLKKRMFVQGNTDNPAIIEVENKYKTNFNLA